MVSEEAIKAFCMYNSPDYCTTRRYREHNLRHDKRGISISFCGGACSGEEYLSCPNLQAVVSSSKDRMLYQVKLVDMHKYCLSQNRGYDVGFEFAWQDWILNYAEAFSEHFDKRGERDLNVLLEHCTHPNTASHFKELLRKLESRPKQTSHCLQEAVA